MRKVSELYKKEMSKQLRGRSYLRINFGVVDVDAADDMTTSDNGHIFVSEPNKISKYVQEYSYATAENKGFSLNGTQRVFPETAEKLLYQGYISDVLSGADGYFSPQPTIVLNFSKLHRTKGFSLILYLLNN